MKRVTLIFLCSISFVSLPAQDLVYARKIIDTLTSKYFWGRGYTNNGMHKAADFLAGEFKSLGLQSFTRKGFLQEFSYPVNTFPGKMEVTVNEKILRPGYDFIVSPESKGVKFKGSLTLRDSTHFINLENKIAVALEDRLIWSVSGKPEDYTSIQLNKKSLFEKPSGIIVDIENKFVGNFIAANVCGYVKGTLQPDSLLMITAHYDHLGGMGTETYFPGANDNASGIALLLSLAKHYSKNPPPFSIAFICFAGEEAGLVGSRYFSENPLFSLKKVIFLINTDLTGTGDDGITVVNGSIFRKEFAWLNEINNRENYFVKIKARGMAANSDHYWFSEKGVHAFFIYTLGGVTAYHDVHDKAATLPLTEFEDLFKLMVEFNERVVKK